MKNRGVLISEDDFQRRISLDLETISEGFHTSYRFRNQGKYQGDPRRVSSLVHEFLVLHRSYDSDWYKTLYFTISEDTTKLTT